MFGYHAILATDLDTGKTITCFTWRGFPEDGIARAQREAVKFGRRCAEFRAAFLGKELSS